MGTNPTTNTQPTYFVVFGNTQTEWVLGSFNTAEKAIAFSNTLNITQRGEWKSIRTRFINDNPWA
jgi:hypothetical protein